MLEEGASGHTARRSGLRRRVILAVGVVVAIGVAFGAVHGVCELAIEAAERRSTACRNALHESGEGNPDDCRQLGVLFSLARRLPSTHDAARRVEVEVEAAVLEDELDVAVLRDFDVEARDAAARKLVAVYEGEYVPERRLVSRFGKLVAVGAHALVVELASEGTSSYERKLALRSALELGDWQAAHRVARMAADDDYDLAKTAAIVACIVGDRETAATRWREADLDWRKGGDKPLRDLQLVAVHCELPRGDEPLDDFTRASVSRLEDAYTPEARLDGGFGRHERAMSVARMVMRSELLVWSDVEGKGVEVLEAMRDGTMLELMPAGVATSEARPAADGLVRVEELEAAARRMAELHATAPVELTYGVLGDVLRPRESLAWAGYCLATIAASERAWRGQVGAARAIYTVARDLAATDDFRVFSPGGELPSLGLLAELDPDAALRVARALPDAVLATVAAEPQVELRVQLALVHEQAGDRERALELMAGALELLPRLSSDLLSHVDEGARFVHAGLLLRAGRASSLSLRAPEDIRGRLPDEAEVFALWWVAAQAEPSQQFAFRWQSAGESKMWVGMPDWALPSALELLGRAAPAEHRELWLDVASSDMQTSSLEMIRARARAAERSGDTSAASRWRQREAALLAPLQNDRAAALYRML